MIVGTWNLNWFPSGNKTKKAADKEEQHINLVGKYIQKSIGSFSTTDNVILCFQEIRDAKTMELLAKSIGLDTLEVSTVTSFKDVAGYPTWQQLSIVSTLPIKEAGQRQLNSGDGVSLQRGIAYAVYDWGSNGTIACFTLHLKSNLTLGDEFIDNQTNIFKREITVTEILRMTRELQEKYGRDLKVIVAGDLNTNEDDARFVSESTLRSFYGAHFRNCFTGVPLEGRITCPAVGSYPDATFDYILYRGFSKMTGRYIFPGSPLSDHNFVIIELE